MFCLLLLLLLFLQSRSRVVLQAPSCLQVDIEPHGSQYHEWDGGDAVRTQLFNDFIDVLEDIRSRMNLLLDGTGIPPCFAADIPNWYDSVNKRFIRHGVEVSPAEEVANIVDTVVIMDYTTEVDKIISRGEGEIAYANLLEKKVVIGAEVDCDQSSTISWCSFTDSQMETAFEQVNSHFSPEPSYDGIALHWVEDYVARASTPGLETVPRAIWSWNLLYLDNIDETLQYLKDHNVNEIYLCVNDFWEDDIASILNKTYPWARVQLLLGDNGRWIYEGRAELDSLVSSSANFLKDLTVLNDPDYGTGVSGVVGSRMWSVGLFWLCMVLVLVVGERRGVE